MISSEPVTAADPSAAAECQPGRTSPGTALRLAAKDAAAAAPWCRRCGAVGTHYLTCPSLRLPAGYRLSHPESGAESVLTPGLHERDLPAETANRSTTTQIYEGTNQIQRMVMARQLLKG